MLECRHCGTDLEGETAHYGARCPRCREPLYERPDAVRRRRDAEQSRGDVCAVHPGNVAVGPCKRCGTFMCGICRSRWEDRVLCLACIQRLMGSGDASPEDVKTHRWQALTSVMLGFASWMLAIPLVFIRAPGMTKETIFGLLMVAAVSMLPALFGLGQAATAVRMRGDRLVTATCGLVLTGAQIGTVAGLVLLVVWKQ